MTAPSLGTWLGAALLRARLLELAAPRLQDRYTIRSVLGHGASGVVVLAFDERLHRDVALKLAPAGRSEEAMLNEGRALAQLRRPQFIVQVLEAGAATIRMGDERRDVVFLLMERATGVTLREWPRAAHASVTDRLEVLARVAVGVEFIHQHRLIHGDIKPENVIVAPSGEPLIVDFGFAAPIRKGAAARTEVVGTQPYLAPEARRGRVRRKSDVYALSVMCWELLTGVHPFDEWREPRLKWWGDLETLPYESAVPEPLRSILRFGMHPWPEMRPTANEIADVLADAAVTLAPRIAPPRRRWKRWVALAAIVGALGYGVTAKPAAFRRVMSSGTYAVTRGENGPRIGELRIVPDGVSSSIATMRIGDAGVWTGPVYVSEKADRVHLLLYEDVRYVARCHEPIHVRLEPWIWSTDGTIDGCDSGGSAAHAVNIERTF